MIIIANRNKIVNPVDKCFSLYYDRNTMLYLQGLTGKTVWTPQPINPAAQKEETP